MAATTTALSPQTNWPQECIDLFDRSIGDNYVVFHQNMEKLYNQVEVRHNGRCLSKSIGKLSKRCDMIQQLWTLYCKKETTNHELCKAKFMQKLIKHDPTKEVCPELIFRSIVPDHIKQQSSNPQPLLHDHTVLLWLKDLYITITEPTLLKQHQQEEIKKIRTDLDKSLREAIRDELISKEDLQIIIDNVTNDRIPEERSETDFVSTFTKRFLNLIQCQPENTQSILEDLKLKNKNLKLNPSKRQNF